MPEHSATEPSEGLPTVGLDPTASPVESTAVPCSSVPRLPAAAPHVAAGRYVLGEEIARGGMGVVYRATDSAFGREVAVKLLKDQFGFDSGAFRRFADEARITAQLQHPSVPPVHDFGAMEDGRPFLVMKLVRGRTLDALLANRADLAGDRGRFIAAFEQVCQALAYAHAHSVIHRDLKPANVMVGNFGEVQVMDWGLSKVLSERGPHEEDPAETANWTAIQSLRELDGSFTQMGSVLGTPAYMPPEQAIGAIGKIDAQSDVFGLGAILVVILTGSPPYSGGATETVRLQAAQGKLDECFSRLDNCETDPDLVALCKRCLNPDQKNRPIDAGEVARAVAQLRQAADERARLAELDRVVADGARVAAEVKAAEQRKRRRVQAALAAAVVLLILGTAAVAWYFDRQARDRRDEIANRTRDEDNRRERNNAATVDLLGRCEEALRAGDGPKARVALEAAESRASEGGADEWALRLDRLRLDLALLNDLEAIENFLWTSVDNEHPKQAAIAARLQQALAPFGADPIVVAPEEATARISVSKIRERVIAALDRLLSLSRSSRVRAVLQIADSDAFRNDFRDAVLVGDGAKTLAEVAARTSAQEQPPGFVVIMGEYSAIPVERRRELLRGALQRRPDDLGLLMTLGATYRINHRAQAEERARWYQAAVGVAPANSVAHINLGIALNDLGLLNQAEVEFREASRLDSKSAWAINNLGWVLEQLGDSLGAEREYRKAIGMDSKLAMAHVSLGQLLNQQDHMDRAEAEVRKAIEIEPDLSPAHNILGLVLRKQGDLVGAEAEYRKAIQLDHNDAVPHNNLGYLFEYFTDDLEGAIAEYKEAVRLDRSLAIAATNLARAERKRVLVARLPGILAGTDRLTSPAEMCDFAEVCAQMRHPKHGEAVRFFERAFAADQRLAEDTSNWFRYSAACSAALAGSGMGVDAPSEASARTALQAKARAWLRADLAVHRAHAASIQIAQRKAATEGLAHWLEDSDLSSTRPGLGRIAMPAAERAEWDALWSEVRATLAEARKPPPSAEIVPASQPDR